VQAEDGIRDRNVTGVQTCALPILQQIDAGPVNEVDARLTSQLNEKASSQYDSLTIKVPSDFSSVSEAITKMSEYQTKRNVVINRSEERRVGKEGRTR